MHDIVKPVHVLACRPGNAPEDERAEEGVVESPTVVAKDGAEDPPLAVLIGPQQGTRLAIFVAAREERNLFWIAEQVPVAFVLEMGLLKVAENGVFRIRGKFEVECPVAELGLAILPRQANPLRELVRRTLKKTTSSPGWCGDGSFLRR